MWGTSTSSPPTDPAASTAVLASSVSRAMVNTIPGSTTPEVSGNNGNVWFSSVMVFLLSSPGPAPARGRESLPVQQPAGYRDPPPAGAVPGAEPAGPGSVQAGISRSDGGSRPGPG